MKDKLSKVKNLVKKYGLTGTIKKMTGYIYSNYIVRISMKEKIYVALNKKEIRKRLKRMLEREDYDRIVVWRSSFGWDVPLYQRPQHIFTNFAKQRTLVLYEVTRFTDDVKRIKRQSENLYLVNFMNKAFANYIFEAIEQQEKPRYVQFYSTDWTLTKGQIEEYERRGYKVVYEYIDDLNPHLAGTDELPVNVREKYEKTMKEKDSIVVVTADALQRDVLSKRGDSHLVFSCNGVDYNHFHNEIDHAAAFFAAEAVIVLPVRQDMEGGRFFIVERAAAPVAPALGLQGHIAAHHVQYVVPSHQLFQKTLGECHAPASFPKCCTK